MGRKRLYTEEQVRQKNRVAVKRWSSEHPERARELARKATNKQRQKPDFLIKYKFRSGLPRLFRRRGIKRPCEICNTLNSEIHHQNYNDPYDIIWLCHLHHIQLHKILKQTNE